MNIIVYYSSSGDIVSISKFYSTVDMPSTVNSYLSLTSLPADDIAVISEYKVVNGELYHVGVKPSEYHKWNLTSRSWELSLYDAKLSKKEQLKSLRDSKEFGPFTYNGMVFDGDADAQRRIAGLVSAANTSLASGYSFTKDFTLADNSIVQLTAEDIVGLGMAKLFQIDAAFQEYRTKRAAIEAATTIEELNAIL